MNQSPLYGYVSGNRNNEWNKRKRPRARWEHFVEVVDTCKLCQYMCSIYSNSACETTNHWALVYDNKRQKSGNSFDWLTPGRSQKSFRESKSRHSFPPIHLAHYIFHFHQPSLYQCRELATGKTSETISVSRQAQLIRLCPKAACVARA